MADSDSGLFGALPGSTKGIIFGGLLIAWGLIAMFVSYLNDSRALGILLEDYAPKNGLCYGGVWIVAGAVIIAFCKIGAAGPRRRIHDDHAEPREHALRNHSHGHSGRDLH